MTIAIIKVLVTPRRAYLVFLKGEHTVQMTWRCLPTKFELHQLFPCCYDEENAPDVGLLDLANKNKGCLVKFEFQINNK